MSNNHSQARTKTTHFSLVLLAVFSLVILTPKEAFAASAGDTWREPVTGMEFVWIPKGCNIIGNDIGNDKELPVREVCLDGFWMGKLEVTQREWSRLAWLNPSRFKEQLHPVEQVTWRNVQRFIEQLNKKSEFHFRLPTQIEWEYAARAGTQTLRFWGNNEKEACAYANVHDITTERIVKFRVDYFDCDDKYPTTAPVGSFKPNQFGLYDMLGNVAEWCKDSCRPVLNSDLETEIECTPRGGGWSSLPHQVRASSHTWFDYGSYSHTGFRLIRK